MQSVICVGSALIDELYFCKEPVITGTSNPATVSKKIGGVISNIAFHLAYLGVKVDFITIIGNDADGRWIKDEFLKLNINPENIHQVEDSTGKYVSFLNADGSLHAAACVDICENHLTIEFLKSKINSLNESDIIICDTNISKEAIQWLIHFAKDNNKQLIIEPVSVAKSKKLENLDLEDVFMITPNEDEMNSITGLPLINTQNLNNFISNKRIKNIWLRKGAQGSALLNHSKHIHLNAVEINIIDSTGAGDAALAGWIAGFVHQFDEMNCLQLGHSLAFEVLQIKGAVKHDITFPQLLAYQQKYYPHES